MTFTKLRFALPLDPVSLVLGSNADTQVSFTFAHDADTMLSRSETERLLREENPLGFHLDIDYTLHLEAPAELEEGEAEASMPVDESPSAPESDSSAPPPDEGDGNDLSAAPLPDDIESEYIIHSSG